MKFYGKYDVRRKFRYCALLKAQCRKAHAFSLVELLVVIAVIGIISAIALPVLHKISENSHINKSQRNAQSLSSTAGAAQAAGASIDLTSIEAAIAQLRDGVNGSGAFENTKFKVAPFDAEEIERIKPYLSIDSGTLVYNKVPVTP